MSEVLILGNGISRLSYDAEIRSYPGEVWACNRAYLEYGEILARLTGHSDVMQAAAQYRKNQGCGFEIWGGHLGRPIPGAIPFTAPPKWLRDSGTTLVAQALHEGRSVALAGFDLGGPDIHSPGLETQDKYNWVSRWREILTEWGTDRIRWIGHDHTEYLLSGESPHRYANLYKRGIPHIADAEYHEAFEQHTGRPAVRGRKETVMVKVRFLRGQSAGFVTEYREDIANILASKGEVEIIKKPEKPEQPKPKPESKDRTGK